jgi:hypothetical protein
MDDMTARNSGPVPTRTHDRENRIQTTSSSEESA